MSQFFKKRDSFYFFHIKSKRGMCQIDIHTYFSVKVEKVAQMRCRRRKTVKNICEKVKRQSLLMTIMRLPIYSRLVSYRLKFLLVLDFSIKKNFFSLLLHITNVKYV